MLTSIDTKWEDLRGKFLQEKQTLDRTKMSSNEKDAQLRALFKEQDLQAYYSWMIHQPAFSPPTIVIPSGEEFLDALSNTDFRNAANVHKLTRTLSMPCAPYIPLGNFKALPYRLVPNSRVLASDLPANHASNRSTDGSLVLDCNFLAVNPQVRPLVYGLHCERRSKQTATSTQSGISDCDSVSKSQKDGFVFYQLGHLQSSTYSSDELTEQMRLNGKWTNANFAVVVKLTPNGKRDGIYIMFNFLPWDEVKQKHTTYAPENVSWGFLPKLGETQIFYAKIADRFEDFEEGKELTITGIHQDPAELSWAVKTADGLFVPDPKACMASQQLHEEAIRVTKAGKTKKGTHKSKGNRKAKKHNTLSANTTPEKSRTTKADAASHKDSKEQRPTKHHSRTSPTGSEKSQHTKKHRNGMDDEGKHARFRKSKRSQKTEQLDTTYQEDSIGSQSSRAVVDTADLCNGNCGDGQELGTAICAQATGGKFHLPSTCMHTGGYKDIDSSAHLRVVAP